MIVTACATVASLPFPSFFAGNPFTLFYLAAALATWYGGFGAGLVSVFAGAIAADYFLLPPRNHFGFDSTGALLRVLLFVIVACIITGCIAAAHQRRRAPSHHAGDDAVSADTGERADVGRGEQSVAERGLPLRLLDLRTHLTVATLAAAQLRRRHVSTITAARLCVYIIRAHAQMLADIQALEAELDDDGQRRDPPR
ncbi:MAG: DUF4118 domain-containing protein [Thermomicrobiales bacterium]